MYWPNEGESKTYGVYTIRTAEELLFPNYTIRTLYIEKVFPDLDKINRSIRHIRDFFH